MSFSRCSSRQDQTRHASAVRLSFLLFSAEPFQLQNHPSSKSLWWPQRLESYAVLPFPLMPPLTQRSVRRRCRLPLVTFFFQFSPRQFSSSRTLRSSKLFMPFFESCSSTLLSHFCCCTTTSFFRVFSPSLPGLLFYLLSMHMITPHPLLWTIFFLCGIICTYPFFALRYLHHSVRLVRFRFPSCFACGSRFTSPCLMRVGSLRLGVESLTS